MPTPPSREITLRFLAQPTDVNFGGKVHGGTVMKWIDQAAYACAAGWSQSYCVTVYVDGIRFLRPLRVGHMVEARARLIHTGRTSMHILVELSSGDPRQAEYTVTTRCVIVFVAVDDAGTPQAIAPWVPQSAVDQRLEQYALARLELNRSVEPLSEVLDD